jgi:hypothetical protein
MYEGVPNEHRRGFKLDMAEQRWRKLDTCQLLPLVR